MYIGELWTENAWCNKCSWLRNLSKPHTIYKAVLYINIPHNLITFIWKLQYIIETLIYLPFIYLAEVQFFFHFSFLIFHEIIDKYSCVWYCCKIRVEKENFLKGFINLVKKYDPLPWPFSVLYIEVFFFAYLSIFVFRVWMKGSTTTTYKCSLN